MTPPPCEVPCGWEGTLSNTTSIRGKCQVFIEASCERFLYKMVRRIVGALVEVGKGRLKAESIASASRRQIPTAPPQGLSLEEVVYPDDIQQAMGFG